MDELRLLLLVEPDLRPQGRAALRHLLESRAIPKERYRVMRCPPVQPPYGFAAYLARAKPIFRERFARQRAACGAVIGLGGKPCELLTGSPSWQMDRWVRSRSWTLNPYGHVWILHSPDDYQWNEGRRRQCYLALALAARQIGLQPRCQPMPPFQSLPWKHRRTPWNKPNRVIDQV